MIKVYCDDEVLMMTLSQLKKSKLNVIQNETNGYSHDWKEVFPFTEDKIKNIQGQQTIRCTRKPVGPVIGSSIVSFS